MIAVDRSETKRYVWSDRMEHSLNRFFREAFAKAQEAGLDLVRIFSVRNTPVCKMSTTTSIVMSSPTRKRAKKKQNNWHQVRLSPNIDTNDLRQRSMQQENFFLKDNVGYITFPWRNGTYGKQQTCTWWFCRTSCRCESCWESPKIERSMTMFLSESVKQLSQTTCFGTCSW